MDRRNNVHPIAEPPTHSNWVLLYSGKSDDSSREPFVLARYARPQYPSGVMASLTHPLPLRWQVMHGGEYHGATHWAEVAWLFEGVER